MIVCPSTKGDAKYITTNKCIPCLEFCALSLVTDLLQLLDISYWGIRKILTLSSFTDNDDVNKWKPFPRYWPFVRGIHRPPVNYPPKRPVTRSFDVYIGLRLNTRLSKQSWGWWFETSLRPLWRHCNAIRNCAMSLLIPAVTSTAGLPPFKYFL